jgi:HEAT repeat protein
MLPTWLLLPFFIALNAGILAGANALGNIELRRRLRRWGDVAESCGFSVSPASKPRPKKMRLEATAGALAMELQPAPHGVRVVLAIPGPPGFAGVRIRREVPHRTPGSVREIEVGDGLFDRTFLIEGPTRIVALLLTAEARRQLVSLNAESLRLVLAGGELLVEVSEWKLPQILALLLDLGRRLAEPVDAAQRLAENVQQDPEAGARLHNLILLARELPGDPRTVDVLRRAASDASLHVRLRAAIELGAEGRAALAEIAEGLEDDTCSAAALSALGCELPLDRTQGILVHALCQRRLQTARACLEELGRGGGAAAVETLAKVLAREHGELAAAAALALGAAGATAAEPPLLHALRRDPAELRVAAASALARAGSSSAVLPLKEAAARFPGDGALQKAARQAIAEIQSRVQGASPGQLSLSADEAGQLSLAQAEAGELSLAPNTGGELSLPPAQPGQLSLRPNEREPRVPPE